MLLRIISKVGRESQRESVVEYKNTVSEKFLSALLAVNEAEIQSAIEGTDIKPIKKSMPRGEANFYTVDVIPNIIRRIADVGGTEKPWLMETDPDSDEIDIRLPSGARIQIEKAS